MASYQLHCVSPSIKRADSLFLPFVTDIDCKLCKLSDQQALYHPERYGDVCWCQQALPDRKCTNMTYEKECNAYSRVIHDKFRHPYNNEACQACDKDGEADVARPQQCVCDCTMDDLGKFVYLHYVTGVRLPRVRVCIEYYSKGQSGNSCLVKQCQTGFEVYDNMCMSMATAQACYPPKQNRHKPDFLIADLFLQRTTPCTSLPTLYNNLLTQDLTDPMQCALLYFDSVAFANLSDSPLAIYQKNYSRN